MASWFPWFSVGTSPYGDSPHSEYSDRYSRDARGNVEYALPAGDREPRYTPGVSEYSDRYSDGRYAPRAKAAFDARYTPGVSEYADRYARPGEAPAYTPASHRGEYDYRHGMSEYADRYGAFARGAVPDWAAVDTSHRKRGLNFHGGADSSPAFSSALFATAVVFCVSVLGAAS